MLLGAASVAAAEGQAPRGGRRGPGMRGPRGRLMGLLAREQVQKELKLSEEQVAKVKKLGKELSAEMRKESSGLRNIEDREKRQHKRSELAAQFDCKTREKLGDVLNKEQLTRLDQIRLQTRPVADALADKDVASQLKLTEEQKRKLAEVKNDMQTKLYAMIASMRGASREQRGELPEKVRKLRSDADKQALELLTAEQKQAFTKMQGKKFELQTGRGIR